MRMDRFTTKLQEALQRAVDVAGELGHQRLEPEHIIFALLRQEDSMLIEVFDKLGFPSFTVIKRVEEFLKDLPSVSGSSAQNHFSERTNTLLRRAAKEAHNFKDEYLSAEHILLALLEDNESVVTQALKTKGIDKEKVLM
ncbi:MAG: type VI secretion system ATPase TssH, partial [Candidatus Omnitrophica bacterium]|nr:type VI secretion system ATPase TssH [Candidatus Omnitrophota bacterium]